MDPIAWKILQYGLSLLVGIAGIFYRWHKYRSILEKNANAEIDALNFIFYKPLALSALLYISTIVSELKFVNFSEYLNTKSDIIALSKNLGRAYSEIGDNKILISILDDKIQKLTRFAEYTTNNEKVFIIKKANNEYLESAYKIFQNANDDSKIYATSYVNPDDWWKGDEGRDYLQSNYDFIKKKRGEIIRIHLFKDVSEFNFFKEIMASEKNNGIKVYYLYTQDIPENYNLKQDIIVVSNQLAGKLDLDEKRNSISVSYYASTDIINEHMKVIEKLLSLSKIKQL